MPQGRSTTLTPQGEAAPSVPLSVGVYAVAAAAVLAGLWLASRTSYLLFHSLAETISIVVAWALFIVAWNARRFLAHGFLVFLGVAFLATGAIDLVHMLAYKGMGVFPGATADLPTQLWIAGRYLEALSLLAAPVLLTRRVNPYGLLAAYAALVAVLLAAIFRGWFPACFVEGQGLTPFKIASEYVVCGLLAGAMVFVYLRRAHLDRAVLRWLLAAEGVSIATEMDFSWYGDVYGLVNLLGHVLKIAAFFLFYKAVVETGLRRPYRLLFRELGQAVERLEQARRAAEAANEAKGRFLAGVSHELRTPVSAILGMVDLALPKQVDPTARDFLQTARSSADLLLVLLNDLLDSAKIEAGKLKLEAVPFSLRRVLDRTAQTLAARAREKGVAFSCRVPPEVPDAVVGDQVRLRQVLLNLVGNGIKFTEAGEVTVEARVESQTDAEVCLRFAVRDTGIGMSRAELDRIFQPFAQADATTARRYGGTGLGLSICSSLVGMMGGRIWAESEPGRGSTFTFTVRLPLAAELPAEPEVADVSAPAAAALRILLVEDNRANQKLTTYVLQRRGHAVETAGDGRQAVRMTQEKPYDAILMDVQMPGMDGLEATQAIRAGEEEGRRVPIVAMTAHAMEGDRQRCLAAGMDGYLSKPIDARQMVALVERLSGSPATAPQPVTPAAELPQEPAQHAAAVFDAQEALARCFDSPEMVEQMIQSFFEETETLLPQMRAALEKEDLAEVGRLGHRMKGIVAYLGARPARDAALGVEHFHKTAAEEAVDALEHECLRLKATLLEQRPAQGE